MPNRGCLSFLHTWIVRYMANEGEPTNPQTSAGKPKAPRRQNSNPRLSCSDVTSTTDISSLSSSLQGANLTVFTTADLKAATRGFSSGSFIGEGGFGPVYKGHLDDKAQEAPQAVAVKVLNLDGMQGHKEWLTEVIMLGQLRHPNLVKLIGFCYEEKNRMLVYEYMECGSLANLLFNGYDPLPWETRIKIAINAAKGLCFLHEFDQPVIYRDFKASNILLDSDFNAKLADFGLAKDGPKEDETHVSASVRGTHGYAAPEYIMTGHLTTKSDVYSFGVVLLEMLTGRESVDNSRRSRQKCLVEWAKHYLKHPRKLVHIIDPRFEGQYSTKGVFRAAELASQCLSHHPKSRPDMREVVEVLESILKFKDIPPSTFVFSVGDQGQQSSTQSAPSNHPEANTDCHSHDQDQYQESEKKQEGNMKVHPSMDP